MRFAKNLYVSDSLKKKKDKILKKLKNGKCPIGIYLMVLLPEGKNQMEIYSCSLLHQKSFQDEELFVAGIAAGYDDALYLMEEIVQQIYEETGDVDIRTFIRKKEQQEN